MTTDAPTIAAIIAAAGSSSRMGAGIDKQFVPVGGKPLLWHSLRQFAELPGVRQILVTVSAANADRVAQLPLGVIGVAVGTALLPLLSRQLRSRQPLSAHRSMNRAIEMSLLLTLPASACPASAWRHCSASPPPAPAARWNCT